MNNYVLFTGVLVMVRAVAEEAAVLASVALFIGMVVVWAQLLFTM